MTTPVAKTPEIRVEILSPSNSETEIKEQPALGFEAGALEKWEYDQDGGGKFFCGNQGDGSSRRSLAISRSGGDRRNTRQNIVVSG